MLGCKLRVTEARAARVQQRFPELCFNRSCALSAGHCGTQRLSGLGLVALECCSAAALIMPKVV